MKKLIIVFFTTICGLGFAQQNQVTRTYYNYTISQVEDEQLVQQVVNEITAHKGVIGCKYRIKPSNKMAEISFAFEELPRKGEGDKSNQTPDVKKLILDKGLHYNGVTFQTEKITN